MKSEAGSNRPVRPITYKNVLFFLGLFALFGCPCTFGDSGDGTVQNRDYIGVVLQQDPVCTGESVNMTVSVETAPGESAGQTVVVTPLMPPGWQVSPANRVVTLEAKFAETTFQVRTPDSDVGARVVGVRRTHHTQIVPERFDTSTQVSIQRDLITVSATPSSLAVQQGQSLPTNLAIIPRGNTSGSVTLSIDRTPGITFTPSQFSVTLSQGSTTPVNQTILVAADANATIGPRPLVDVRTSAGVRTGGFGVAVVSGTSGFSFSATPTTVVSANGQQSSDVTFTLTSVGGFSGNVVVRQQSDGEIAVLPTINDETFAVGPTAPTVFTRRFERYYSTDDIHVTFTATHAPSATSRQVVITSKHP